MEFSKKSGSCLLSRSVLQLLYLPIPNKVFGIQDLAEVIKESVRLFISPPVLMPKHSLHNNPQVKKSKLIERKREREKEILINIHDINDIPFLLF